MANQLYIKLEHDFSLDSVVIANGTTVTGYSVLRDGTHLGTAAENPMFSRSIDSLGVRVTGATREAREQQLNILVESSSASGLKTLLDAIYQMCDKVTRDGGGTLYYRSDNGTAVTRFKVSSAKVVGPVDLSDYESMYKTTLTLAVVVDPFGLKWDYDLFDDFSVDTVGVAGKYNPGGADWTRQVGSVALTVSAGTANGGSTSPGSLYTHTGSGNTYTDVQATVKITTATATLGPYGGIVICYVDSSNYLYARVKDNGANSQLDIRKVVAGVETSIAAVNLVTRITTLGYQFWIRVRKEGNYVYAENWVTAPTPAGTPTDTNTIALSTAEIALFGSTISGSVGLKFDGNSITTAAKFDDFEVKGCVYRAWTFPDVIGFNQSWGGTIDARVAISYTAATTIPTWIMYSWWPKPPAHNYIWNGAGEVIGNAATGSGSAYGWSFAAVAGVTGAASAGSSGRTVTAGKFRTGVAAIEISNAGGIANTGATFAMYRRFKKGVTYTASAYTHASAGTTTARIGLGVSGDIQYSTAVALSTMPIPPNTSMRYWSSLVAA